MKKKVMMSVLFCICVGVAACSGSPGSSARGGGSSGASGSGAASGAGTSGSNTQAGPATPSYLGRWALSETRSIAHSVSIDASEYFMFLSLGNITQGSFLVQAEEVNTEAQCQDQVFKCLT